MKAGSLGERTGTLTHVKAGSLGGEDWDTDPCEGREFSQLLELCLPFLLIGQVNVGAKFDHAEFLLSTTKSQRSVTQARHKSN